MRKSVYTSYVGFGGLAMSENGSGEALQDRRDEHLAAIGLRFAINSELDTQGSTALADLAAAVGLPEIEVRELLQRHLWREGDVAVLRRLAERLGLVQDPMTGHWRPASLAENGSDQPLTKKSDGP